jgi:hypothetical protein
VLDVLLVTVSEQFFDDGGKLRVFVERLCPILLELLKLREKGHSIAIFKRR